MRPGFRYGLKSEYGLKMKHSAWMPAVMAGLIGVSGVAVAAGKAPVPRNKDIVRGVQAFLAQHGDLCVAKYDWPRDVTALDREAGTNDALQLPVLEKLGLVESVELPSGPASQESAAAAIGVQSSAPLSPQLAPPAPAKRYSLTAQGRQYYLQKKHVVIGAHDIPTEHEADFCLARISLDKVVKWLPPDQADGGWRTTASYTYHIKPVSWLSDPEAQQVFPVAARLVAGQGTLQLTADLVLRDGKWVPAL